MTRWDIPAPNADNPGAKIITLHRRVPVRASADLLPPVGRRVSPAPPELVAQVRRDDAALNRRRLPLAAYDLDEEEAPDLTLGEAISMLAATLVAVAVIETALFVCRVRVGYARACGWLGETYGNGPRGLLWLAGTLLPILIAAFCVGYFGLELAR